MCLTEAAICPLSLFKSERTGTIGNTDGREEMMAGEEKIKPSQTRLRSAAGKSELSVSDSSGAAAIYNAVTQPGVWQEESAALAPGLISAFPEG